MKWCCNFRLIRGEPLQVVGHTEKTFRVLLAGRGWHFLYALDLGRISLQTVSGDVVAHERHSLLSLIPFSRQRCIRALSFASWSAIASASVSTAPKIRISSKIGITPSRPWSALSSLRWNSSGAGEIPKGILVQRYLDQGVPNVVR